MLRREVVDRGGVCLIRVCVPPNLVFQAGKGKYRTDTLLPIVYGSALTSTLSAAVASIGAW